MQFDPQMFPDRIIIIDLNAGTEKMNCLGCGRLAEQLEKKDELCADCYQKWSMDFCDRWCAERFGKREANPSS